MEKINEECIDQECMLRCHECKICCHMYVCNCPDSLITCHLCKHIHLLYRHLQEKDNNGNLSTNAEFMSTFENNENELYASTELRHAVKIIAKGNQEADFETVKSNADEKLQLMQQALDRSTQEDVEAIQHLSAQLTAALNTFQSLVARKATKMSLKRREPPNKKIEVQRFFSTRKKQKLSKRVRFAKPDRKGMQQINATFTQKMLNQTDAQKTGSKLPMRNTVDTKCRVPKGELVCILGYRIVATESNALESRQKSHDLISKK